MNIWSYSLKFISCGCMWQVWECQFEILQTLKSQSYNSFMYMSRMLNSTIVCIISFEIYYMLVWRGMKKGEFSPFISTLLLCFMLKFEVSSSVYYPAKFLNQQPITSTWALLKSRSMFVIVDSLIFIKLLIQKIWGVNNLIIKDEWNYKKKSNHCLT